MNKQLATAGKIRYEWPLETSVERILAQLRLQTILRNR